MKTSIRMKTTQDLVKNLDKGLRHKSGIKQSDFVEHYCGVFRSSAYATRDDSWNEFEKLITHVLGMYMYQKRRAEILGLDTDPRDFVWDYDDNEQFEIDAYLKNNSHLLHLE